MFILHLFLGDFKGIVVQKMIIDIINYISLKAIISLAAGLGIQQRHR